MSASDPLALGIEASQPIRLSIDASSHLAGVIRGLIFGLALLAPVIATAFGPAVRRPYTSEATATPCQPSAKPADPQLADCTRR